MPDHTLATIESGTTHWLARILEPGKEPYYFVPSENVTLMVWLKHAVRKAYPTVEFVDKETFNRAVQEAEA